MNVLESFKKHKFKLSNYIHSHAIQFHGVSIVFIFITRNSSGDEIANVNFL